MRTDLPSMNAGKAMAQASHASNQFMHSHGKSPEAMEWANETDAGFGTVLVLAATFNDILNVQSFVINNDSVVADTILDPTYPYIVDSEIVPLIDDDNHTEEPKELESGDYVCFREEITCSYVFGEEDDVKPLVEHLKLHP